MSRTTSLGEATVRLLCATFGISRQAYYAAGRRRPRPSRPGPRAGAWATAEQLTAAIQTIVQAHPGWGVRKVWAVLRRQGLVASHKRVWALMRHLGLTLPPVAERREEAARGHVTVADSNRRWATDLTTVWTRQDGVVALVPVIDCGDRFAFTCPATKSQEAPCVLAPVGSSLWGEFHRPDDVPDGLELRSDHGRSTPAPTAPPCARAGDSTTPWHPSGDPPAMPWLSASSSPSSPSSSGPVTGSPQTSSTRPSAAGSTTTTISGLIKPSAGRRRPSAEPPTSTTAPPRRAPRANYEPGISSLPECLDWRGTPHSVRGRHASFHLALDPPVRLQGGTHEIRQVTDLVSRVHSSGPRLRQERPGGSRSVLVPSHPCRPVVVDTQRAHLSCRQRKDLDVRRPH